MRGQSAWKRGLRLVISGIAGYAVIVVLTTAGFNGWLGGADLYRGGAVLQVQGALVALVAGLAGGGLAGFIGRRRPLAHAAAVLPFLVVDSTYVLFVFERTTPFWFELVGALTLMAATVAGGALVRLVRRPARA